MFIASCRIQPTRLDHSMPFQERYMPFTPFRMTLMAVALALAGCASQPGASQAPAAAAPATAAAPAPAPTAQAGKPNVVVLATGGTIRSEEHTSELQSQSNLVCRLLL